eukprot:scaffold16813_cov21-Tisochrysis_lutea.AAC.3
MQVFDPCRSQANVFEDTKHLIQSAVDGFNVCIFAYGQVSTEEAGPLFSVLYANLCQVQKLMSHAQSMLTQYVFRCAQACVEPKLKPHALLPAVKESLL